MRKLVRLLTDISLSETSVVDKAACDLADITSVQLVKRSDMNEPQFNPEALKAANIQPEEAGTLRKFFNFLFKPQQRGGISNEEREAILAHVKDPALRKQLDNTIAKWKPILSDAAGSADGYESPGYVTSQADATTHRGLVPGPSDGLPSNANPGKDVGLDDAGGGVQDKSDDMGQGATNAAVTEVDPAKADTFTGGVSGNQLQGYNLDGNKKRPQKAAQPDDDDDYERVIKAISAREDVSESDKQRAVSEYGNVTFADPKNKKYPIDTEAHIRAAWNYINKPKNQAKYSSGEVASIKAKIVAAWKKKIDSAGPPSAKAAQADESNDFQKSLLDVGMFAQIVMGIDQVANVRLMDGAAERGDDADNDLARQLSQLRDEAGQILVQMVAHEVGELGDEKMAQSDVEGLAKALLDRMREHNAAQALEKRGAKFSAADATTLRACKASLTKAGGYFGKAQGKYPDDDDLDNGMAHFSHGMGHFSKIDFEGRQVEGSDLEDRTASDADKPSKAAESTDLRKTIDEAVAPLRDQMKDMKDELEKSQKAAHALEVENARLTAKLEALGSLPVTPRIKVGGLVAKEAADRRVAAAAGATTGPDLTVQSGDEKQLIKQDMSLAFNKAIALARREPVRIAGSPTSGGH